MKRIGDRIATLIECKDNKPICESIRELNLELCERYPIYTENFVKDLTNSK